MDQATRVSGAIDPKQQRSAETLQRILDTVEAMLPEVGSLEALSLNELCAEADVSRSSFYARFRSKDDLVPALCQRFVTQASELAQTTFLDLIAESGHRPVTYGEVARTILTAQVRFHRQLQVIDATASDPRVLNARLEVTRHSTDHICRFLELTRGSTLGRRERDQVLFLVCVIAESLRPDGALPRLRRLLRWEEPELIPAFATLACAALGVDEHAPIALTDLP
mgnify:CR=1 FL=1